MRGRSSEIVALGMLLGQGDVFKVAFLIINPDYSAGKRTSARLCLTGGRRDRYAQKGDNIGFFIDLTTVLPLSGLVAGDPGSFQGPGNRPSTPHWHQDARNGGFIPAFISAAFSNSLGSIVLRPNQYPDLITFVLSIAVILFIIYIEGMRVEEEDHHAGEEQLEEDDYGLGAPEGPESAAQYVRARFHRDDHEGENLR